MRDAKWYTYIWYFRWILNFIFFAAPYFSFSIIMIAINLILNIFLNKLWAGGNLLLIFNTIYLVVQTIFSWPLIFEIPLYLSWFRFFRIFSVLAAFVYSAVYGFVVADWMYQIYFEPVKAYEEYQFIDILANMYLAYNIIFHLHVLPINLAIVVKEFFLLIFPPLLPQDAGKNLDIQDVEDTVDPRTYADIARGKAPDTNERKDSYHTKVHPKNKNKNGKGKN